MELGPRQAKAFVETKDSRRTRCQFACDSLLGVGDKLDDGFESHVRSHDRNSISGSSRMPVDTGRAFDLSQADLGTLVA